jgi:signal peptidase II
MSQKKFLLALAFTGLAGGIFVLDRWTKIFFAQEAVHILIPNVLETTQHHNQGLLANLPVPLLAILLVTAAVMVVVIQQSLERLRKEQTLELFALALVLGGALGNFYDRLVFQYVFDWILVFHRSILNVADLAVGVGVLLFIFVKYLSERRKDS